MRVPARPKLPKGARALGSAPRLASHVDPAAALQRLRHHPGRALTRQALDGEQRYRDAHVALAGRRLSAGVVDGLRISVADGPGGSLLVLGPGRGVAASGHDVVVRIELPVAVDDLVVLPDEAGSEPPRGVGRAAAPAGGGRAAPARGPRRSRARLPRSLPGRSRARWRSTSSSCSTARASPSTPGPPTGRRWPIRPTPRSAATSWPTRSIAARWKVGRRRCHGRHTAFRSPWPRSTTRAGSTCSIAPRWCAAAACRRASRSIRFRARRSSGRRGSRG